MRLPSKTVFVVSTLLAAFFVLSWPAHQSAAVSRPRGSSWSPPPSGEGTVGHSERESPEPTVIAPFVEGGLTWLVKAQYQNGGWGAGSHAAQRIRDPNVVKTDPATTAFVGLALLRTGNTPTSGPYSESTRRATLYLVEAVARSSEASALITASPELRSRPNWDDISTPH